MIEPPGWTRLQSLLLLSPRGARVLANCLGQDPRPLVRLSQDVRDHCFNIAHDLGANAFFVALAVASRSRPNEGLYHWVGEERCRRHMREQVGARFAPAPDGWGRYLLSGREIVFHLEWDRGTEPLDRLRRKTTNYIRFYTNRIAANYAHIFFVFPSLSKELAYHKRVAKDLPQGEQCCVFLTTTVHTIEALSPRGPVWWKVARRVVVGASGSSRLSFDELASRPIEHAYSVNNCIGKPNWWEKRLAGGHA